MKLSDYTHALLKNFSTIEGSILVKKGNILRTISGQKNILAQATVDEEFEKDFGIYDLGRFINVIALFEDPELEFGNHSMQIKSGKNSVKYVYADPSIITTPPEKNIKLPTIDLEFEISEDELESILRAANVMSLPDITVRSDGEEVVMVAHDKKNSSSDEYVIEIENVDEAAKAKVDFKAENFKFILTSYKVQISSKKISQFTAKECDLTYWVAAETTTEFK